MSKRDLPKVRDNDIGKIPPQALDLEEAVLGASLLQKQATYLATRLLKPEYFYKESHQKIFEAIVQLTDNQDPVDIITVTDRLRKNEVLEICGGAYYVSMLTNKVANASNLEYHARIVHEKFLLREQIRISSDNIRDAYEESVDTFDLLDKTQTSLHNLTKGLSDGNTYSTREVAERLAEVMGKNNEGITTGIPTGFKVYDSITGGHQDGHLIIYAARPGMGKTARAVNEIHFQLKKGVKPLFHSLEMTPLELLARLAGLETNTPPEYILKRDLDADLQSKINKYLLSISDLLTIYEFTNLTDIERETALAVQERRCDIVYLDYLQLAKAGYKDPTQDVGEVSKGLKLMAKKLEIPVVAIAQLSRAVETRGGDKRPMLSDLRQSGQIEQDADVVDFLYRPEYYDIDMYEDGESTHGVLEFINGKMRGGRPKETIKMQWDGPLNKISNQEVAPFSPPSVDFDRFQKITMQSRGDDFDDNPF
jgi:replicative DNA helicase